MKKLMQRILMFLVGPPLIAALVLFLPHYHHLALNILVIIFSALGAAELAALLEQKNLRIPKIEAVILGILPSAAMTAVVSFGCDSQITSIVFLLEISWLLLSRIFSPLEVLDGFINRLAAGFTVLIYPGLLMEWIIRMSGWNHAEIIFLTFLCTVFANDSAAWAMGMLFGKKNRGLIPASPNKSVIGFAGGIAASILAGTGAALLWPNVFVSRFDAIPAPAAGFLLGLFCGIAAVLGDLGESAIKRSSGIKDSGNLIPGRGGVLDSIDSIALAAPVFYLAFILLYGH
jgi:phosphatidate cytidylyltransferase